MSGGRQPPTTSMSLPSSPSSVPVTSPFSFVGVAGSAV
jgi:hypothetical protein